MKRLNLGCGNDYRCNYINLDCVKLKDVDVVHNLNEYPYPFIDNEFDEILCDNVLEHLESIVKPLEELHRITKPKGKLIIIVPIFPSVWAMSDPTHKSFYTWFTFNYFRENDGLNYYSKARFNILKRKIRFQKPFFIIEWIVNSTELFKKVYVLFFSMLIPSQFLNVELEIIK